MTDAYCAGRRSVKKLGGWLPSVSVMVALLPATASPQTPAAAATEAETVPEIIVTARKIAEDPQDIPVSVQTLPGEFLDSANLSRLYELQFNIPGLVVNSAGLFGAGFALRGIANQAGTGPPVATHLNGVYLGRSDLAIARMFDLERVEVLKGPQGTLYGRNATGGSINFITRSPEDRFSADIEGAYGSFATTRVQGHVNMPLQNAAVRFAFIGSEGDGYIRNSIDDRRFGEDDFWGLRASLRVDLGDALSVGLMAQHVRDDGASGELWGLRPDFLVDPADIRLTTVTLANPFLVTENDVVSVNVEYDLGLASLRSISGYARNQTSNLNDCAGLPILQGCVRGSRYARYRQWSQELQLLLYGTGPVDGLVGLYYFNADSSSNFHQFIPVVNPNPINDTDSTSRETAGAVFGQATLRLAERWSITGGLRLSRENQRGTAIGTGIQDSPTLLVGEADSDDVSWRFDLAYAATDDVLFYAGVSTGYKSGGLITIPQPDPFGPENLTAYEAGLKSQWLNRRLTVNAAAFYYDYTDLQVSTVTFTGDRQLFEVDNAAKSELYGIDAEGIFRISDRLAVSGGVVWMPKREFVEFRNDLTGDTLSGNKLVRAPESTAAAAVSYEHPLRSLGTLSGRLEYNYRSSHFFTKENDPFFAQDGFGLLNVFLRFESASDKWYIFASGRNLTNQDYFNQVFLQSSPGYPDTYEIGTGYRF